MVDNGGIWDEQSFRDFEINRDKNAINQIETELAEARAEIERLALEIENKQYTITCASEENQQLKESLAEARAEIGQLKQLWSCNLDIIGGELNKQLVEARARLAVLERAHEAKDKLIEQMGRAMEKVIANYRVNLRDLTDFENKQVATLEAALAAERGE